MQLSNLVKSLEDMSEAELLEHVRLLRHRRETVRPAAAKRVERVEKKTSQRKVAGVDKLLKGLSEDERLKLIEQLGG